MSYQLKNGVIHLVCMYGIGSGSGKVRLSCNLPLCLEDLYPIFQQRSYVWEFYAMDFFGHYCLSIFFVVLFARAVNNGNFALKGFQTLQLICLRSIVLS